MLMFCLYKYCTSEREFKRTNNETISDWGLSGARTLLYIKGVYSLIWHQAFQVGPSDKQKIQVTFVLLVFVDLQYPRNVIE